MGHIGKSAPHQSAGGAADSFSLRAKSRLRRLRFDTRLRAQPRGGSRARLQKKLIWRGCEPPSLPPRGKVAPQGRMRGSLTATTRSRAATASTALISQRSGPLTASPAGEAARRKKSAKTILTCTCFCGKLIVVKKAATGSRPSAHLGGLQKPRVIP